MKTLNFDGYVLEVSPISPLAPQAIENQHKKQNPEPARPTYTVEAAGGVVETHLHDETTLETEEEKSVYLTWKQKHSEWQASLMQKVIRMFLLKGVKLVLTKEQEEELELETLLLGIDLPASKLERELFYLEMFVVNTQQKLELVMQTVLSETGVKQEALEQAESLF